MSAGRQRVKITETKRLIQASLLAGLKVTGVECETGGKVRVLVRASGGKPRDADDTDDGKSDWENI
jgi:hypothetical protein